MTSDSVIKCPSDNIDKALFTKLVTHDKEVLCNHMLVLEEVHFTFTPFQSYPTMS